MHGEQHGVQDFGGDDGVAECVCGEELGES